MDFLIIILFTIGGWLFGKIVVSIFFPKPPSNTSGPTFHITNYTTENHLHITDEQLKRLK